VISDERLARFTSPAWWLDLPNGYDHSSPASM